MSTLQNLVAACQADKTCCRNRRRYARKAGIPGLPRSAIPVRREDPGYDEDFQRIREEVNKLSGINTGLICTLAEKLLTGTAKDIRVATYYCWARLHQTAKPVLPKGLSCWRGCCSTMGRNFTLSGSGAVNRRWSGSQAPVFSIACHSGRKWCARMPCALPVRCCSSATVWKPGRKRHVRR